MPSSSLQCLRKPEVGEIHWSGQLLCTNGIPGCHCLEPESKPWRCNIMWSKLLTKQPEKSRSSPSLKFQLINAGKAQKSLFTPSKKKDFWDTWNQSLNCGECIPIHPKEIGWDVREAQRATLSHARSLAPGERSLGSCSSCLMRWCLGYH